MTTSCDRQTPQAWELRRLKTVLEETDHRNEHDGTPLLSLTREHGLILQSESSTSSLVAQDLSKYKVCNHGDLVMNRMQAWSGMFATATRTGLVSPDYTVFRPKSPHCVEFLEHLLKTPHMVTQFAQRSKGIGSGFNRLYTEDFGDCTALIPSPDEQAAIVRYLDQADDLINRYISAKERLIALLEEQRQAATRLAMASPESREARLETVSQLIARPVMRTSARSYTPIGLFNRGRGAFVKEPTNGNDLGDSDFFWIEKGDLIISGQFAWEGAIALVTDEFDGCIASHRFPVMRGIPNVLKTEFLFSVLSSDYGNTLLDFHSRGAAGRNRPLNTRTLLKEKIRIPPSESQQRIADMVLTERDLREQMHRTRTLLGEYRTRLIADVVTGQLDVRDVAVELPAGHP